MRNECSNESICVVCLHPSKYFSIGNCDHPVCYECSTRMRVICKQNECPICRQVMPEVYFVDEIQPFSKFSKQHPFDERYSIYFVGDGSREKYRQIMEHKCKLCSNSFSSFIALSDHMKRSHQLFYCDLCVEHLNLFSFERKCYTRTDLAIHRRKGDIDDKSHRGHPLCEFCDERFMDNDELYRHSRKEHLYCHFCDADGVHMFYKSYQELQDHFRQKHFLCEEDQCKHERFISAFASEIDLKAHIAQYHKNKLDKLGAKAMKTLDFDFNIARKGPRAVYDRDDRSSLRQRAPRLEDEGLSMPKFSVDTEVVPELNSATQFPALSEDMAAKNVSSSNANSMANRVANQNKISTMMHSAYRGKSAEEEFPSLVPTSNKSLNLMTTQPKLDFSACKSVKKKPMTTIKKSSHSSKHFDSTSSPNSFLTLASDTDFPTLPSNTPPLVLNSYTSIKPNPTSKIIVSQPVSEVKPVTKVAKFNNTPSDFPTLCDTIACDSSNKLNNNSDKVKKFSSSLKKDNDHRTNAPGRDMDSLQAIPSSMNTNKKPASISVTSTKPKVISPPPGFKKLNHESGHSKAKINSIDTIPEKTRILSYIEPKNFHERNQVLIKKIRSFLATSDMNFLEFKTLSQDFRNNGKSARDYYVECNNMLGCAFCEVFPELIVLLPDISKQQDLLRIHKKMKKDVSKLAVCSDCRQVLSSNELSEHREIHKLNSGTS